LHIFDISDINNPQWVNRIDTGYDAVDLAMSGNYLYVVDFQGYFYIVDVTDPLLPQVVGQVELPQGEAYGCAVDGDYAYVAYWHTLFVVDIDPPETMSIVQSIEFEGLLRDVATGGGYVYVAYHSTSGPAALAILDIDPPNDFQVINTVMTDENKEDPSSIIYEDGYVYMGTTWILGGCFKAIDVSPVEDASIVKSVEMNGEINSIAVSGDYAFATNAAYGLQILDINPPESSNLLANGISTGGADGVDVAASYAFVGGALGLQVIDVDPVGSPWVVSGIDTPWNAWDVEVTGGYAYVADLGGRVQIIDVNQPEMAHNVSTLWTSDPVGGLAISNGYAFLAAKTLDIVDVEPPGTAEFVKHVPTDFTVAYVALDGGYVYAADRWKNLMIVDVDPIETAYMVKNVDISLSPFSVSGSEGYAYIAGTPGLGGDFRIVDADPPESASVTGSVQFSSDGLGNDTSGGYAYITTRPNGLLIVDIHDPSSPEIVNYYTTLSGYGVKVVGTNIYVVGTVLCILDANDPVNPCEITHVHLPTFARDFTISGDYVYIADGSGGLRILQLL
jgi:hypothetical protein